MAEFRLAHIKTSVHEGFPGWVNHPSDPGGETVAGLTRRDNPDFPGWAEVDAIKRRLGSGASQPVINRELGKSKTLHSAVEQWYLKYWWTPLKLNGEKSQRLANTVYDFAVNSGKRPQPGEIEGLYARARAVLESKGLGDAY